MEQFNNLTVGELFQLLQMITRNNAEEMKTNNHHLFDLIRHTTPDNNKRAEKEEINLKNAKLIKENVLLIHLHNYLLDFYRQKWNQIAKVSPGIKEEEHYCNPSNQTVCPAPVETKNKKGFLQKSLAKLEADLDSCIKNENYEECARIQAIINKKKNVA